MTDENFKNYMRHIMSMRGLTNNELVNTYWKHAGEIDEIGRLGFIIRGNLQWESSNQQGVTGCKDIWLKSNHYESVGKHIGEEPVRNYLQMYMNTYEIWGTIALDIDPGNAETVRPQIERALDQITCVCNTMSFLWGVSLRWSPATYRLVRHSSLPLPPEQMETESWDCEPLPQSQEDQSSSVINDEHISQQLFPLIEKVDDMPPTVQNVIKTAMDWHAQGNLYMSGLNRFVNYWEAIESISSFFYDSLPANLVERKPKSEKKDAIMRLLQKINRRNCMELVSECANIYKPTARDKITRFLHVVTDTAENQSRLENVLFEKRPSLKMIRDDIAHGRISEHDFQTVESFRKRLYDAQQVSSEIILRTINNSKELARQLEA